MLIIGSHVSYKNSTQLLGSVEEAITYGANAFMFYTGAPQNTQRGEINDLVTYEALQKMKENNIMLENVVCHAPYIVNLANNIDPEKYEFAKKFLRQEIERCMQLGVRKIVLHPGSATKLDRTDALNNIIKGLNSILYPDDNIMILLETMAGKGTELGINLEELKYIIENIKLKEKIGVCLDTCHLSDSGININEFDKYLDEFDKQIGIDKIGCVHLNDSKNPIGARKDRHENLGYGTIGFDTLINVAYNARLESVPKLLETPFVDREYAPYKFEIEEIRNKKFNPNLYDEIVSYYRGTNE
ncbi:deoxyribonuclease IV [bacterium]|nr:deoxyribonuclease IV [bacterium]MBD9114805.1 deoxyribonuclease IV [bacterium]